MRPFLTAEEMQKCDKAAARTFGIPGRLLMENAGSGVARWIMDRFRPLEGRVAAVVCGKGNNGGDGFVVARHLANAGAVVHVLLIEPPSGGDAGVNLTILKKLARAARGHISLRPFSRSAAGSIRPDLIVDSIFGTGFSGTPQKMYKAAIDWINGQSVPIISIDIPSGVNGTTGIGSPSVMADTTLALGAMKQGLLCNDGKKASGRTEVIDIGIPNPVFSSVRPRTLLVEESDVRAMLPARSPTAHKYSAGKVYVLAGSRGFTGAATLAAQAALRIGAGAVVLGAPEAIYPVLARKLTEVIVEPLPSTPEGSVSSQALEPVLNRISWADCVVLGPGLSRNPDTAALVRMLISRISGPAVLDADVLNILFENGKESLKKRKGPFILTPHTGEFSRMAGIPSKEIEAHRVDSVRQFAKHHSAVVMLKGVPTVTADPNGDVYANPTGNPGMATIGTGDVLSGMVGGLWSQGMSGVHAALSAAFLHGLAGDLAAEDVGQKGLVAGDLIDFLPRAVRRVEEGR